MITLTIKEMLQLHSLKIMAEAMVSMERTEPYIFSQEDVAVLTKVLENFNTAGCVKLRLRHPRRPAPPKT